MSFGKSIELFLVNGTADSIITAELSNWNGKAIKIPRIEVPTCKRADVCDAGVYFLFCKDDDGTDSVYIGEAENIKDRLIQHIRDNQADKEKYYWTTAVLFTGRDLNKALIRYLENRLVEIARNSNRYKVLTKNTYKNTVMKESQVAAMDEFIVCRSVTPWKLVLTGVDKNIVYTWDYFGAEEMVMYRDLQAWRKKEIITAPKIIIEDADLREAWRQDMSDTYKALINVEYPEELFDLSDAKFETLLKDASPVIREIIKSTAISMIRAENYPSLAKIIKIDEVFGTALQDFLSNN